MPTTVAVPTPLQIGLDSWIIQDGNYSDFRVGDERQFALEFGALTIEPSTVAIPMLRHVEGARYQFQGRTLLTSSDYSVMDFGLLAYHEGQQAELPAPGLAACGELYLGIDPFFWRDSHAHVPGAPDLFRQWRITGILLETTPWQVHHDLRGRQVQTRRPGPGEFRNIASTDAWHDDDGHAHYILQCEAM
jgi:hypothetical protein